MITVISATNRPNSNTLKISKNYFRLLQQKKIPSKLLSLEQLPATITKHDLYGHRSGEFQELIDEYIYPSSKLVFIAPEYNGSFPGILKVFIDALHPDLNRNKKTSLIGVATGRAGNLRGMDHLTSILNYLGMHVHPYKQPISKVLEVMDEQGNITDLHTLAILEKHLDTFVDW